MVLVAEPAMFVGLGVRVGMGVVVGAAFVSVGVGVLGGRPAGVEDGVDVADPGRERRRGGWDCRPQERG